ncbi:hypothetical protein WMY93_007011 [Mugilogobius chulae]|uniref:Transcription factor IIIA n=1 Tax=Mugilogobius chulae TaxID=88201 RepID=A0AAW0PQ56_9GOBI
MKVKVDQYKRFICSFQGCSAAYNKQWKLDAHLCKHTGVKPHTCEHEGCGKSFSSPYHLSRHQLIHSGEKPFPCTEPGCTEAFTTNSNRMRHIDRYHSQESRKYVCKFENCGLTFKKNKQLKVHVCEEHEKLPPYKCTFEGCTMRFAFPSRRKRHEKVHRGYPCPDESCDFGGRTWTELMAHRREKHSPSYSCDQCSRVFKDQHNLNQHKRVHSDYRLVLVCPRDDCERTFTTAFNLQSHIRSFHEELRPFTCPLPGCGRSFAMKQSLTRHSVVHDPERKKIVRTQNKRSLASRLSGFKDPKTHVTVPKPDPSPCPVQPLAQTSAHAQDQELIVEPKTEPEPVPISCPVQSPVLSPAPGSDPGPSPGLVQDSVKLVSLLQDPSLRRDTHEHKSLTASVTA